jgi:GxxExxY protein
MHANNTNSEILCPKLSYSVTGTCFDVHNSLGRFSRERQYGDRIERGLQKSSLAYKREFTHDDTGNRLDFIISGLDGQLVLEIKAKPIISKPDYYQLQRYLQSTGIQLGLLVNFRNQYIKPLRIIRIDTDARAKFV